MTVVPIDRQAFRARLEDACKRSLDPEAGLFGPTSVTWRLLRESVGFLGAGRAALLQLAHPWVANAIEQHSKTKTDPIGRFHRTFENVFTILFGNLDQVTRVATDLNALHGRITGRIHEESGAFAAGSKYFANEAHAMSWVHATLWETAIAMHEIVLGPLPRATKEAFYEETKLFAYCFGIPDAILPPTWHDFLAYNEAMWDGRELAVRATARDIAQYLFRVDLFPGSSAALSFVRVFTAETMPMRLREEFELPRRSLATRAVYGSGVATLRRAYPRLPARLRYIPSYHEAMDRLRGRPQADGVTRALNRVWVGKPDLVGASVK